LAGPMLRDALATSTFTDDRTMELVVALAAGIYEARSNGIGPCDLSLDNLMFAAGPGGRLCLLRALAEGVNTGGPDPERDLAELSALRATLERGRDDALGASWKTPESLTDLRLAAQQSSGRRTPPSSEPGASIGRWRIGRRLSEGLRATLYEVSSGE